MMKKFKWFIIATLLGVALFVGGLYIGNQTPESETGFMTEDIAIINLDESVEYLGEVRNFGAELMTGVEPRYQLTGLTDARNGLESGRFAAYIIIPADFSSHVISINTEMPVESTFNFVISRYLEEETRLLAFYHVMAFQESYRERLSAMYLASILATFHRGQDNAQFVLANDEIDLERILEFEPSQLISFVELDEFRVLEHNLTEIDSSEYVVRTGQIMEEHVNANQNFMLLSQTELATLLANFNHANDEFWESISFDDPISLLDELDPFVISPDLAAFFDEIDELNEELIGIDEESLEEIETILNDLIALLEEAPTDIALILDEIGLILEDITAHLSLLEDIRGIKDAIESQFTAYRLNQDIINAYQTATHAILEIVMTYQDETFADLTTYLAYLAEFDLLFQLLHLDPNDYSGQTWLEIFLNIEINTFINAQNDIIGLVENHYLSELEELADGLDIFLEAMIAQLGLIIDGLEIEFENLADQLDFSVEQLQLIDFEAATVEIVRASRTELEQAINDDIDEKMVAIDEMLASLGAEQEAFITNIVTSHASGQSLLSGYVQAIFNHDPSIFIDEALLWSHLETLSSNTQTLMNGISDGYLDFLEFTQSFTAYSNTQISTMRDDVRDANTETNTRITDEVNTLRTARSNKNEENQELLNTLTNTLLHTRSGSLVNHDLVSALATPVAVQGNYEARFITLTVTEIGWMIPTVIGVLTTAMVVFVLDVLLSKDVKEEEID